MIKCFYKELSLEPCCRIEVTNFGFKYFIDALPRSGIWLSFKSEAREERRNSADWGEYQGVRAIVGLEAGVHLSECTDSAEAAGG